MKARVLLFNPESEFYAMPLGLLAVGSALNSDRFDVQIFDERLDPQAPSKVLAAAADAVCVGMTVFSGRPIGSALRLARQLKKQFPSLPVIWGGWHPSIFPEQCIASGVVDAVVIGQGEAAFADLMDAIHDSSRWPGIPGLCVSVSGSPHRTRARALAKMDSLPEVRYALVDVESYFKHKNHRQLDYSSSRGCPYRCTFCADPMVYGSKWTGLSVERIVSELSAAHRQYKFDEVFFLDDDLFASLKRIQSLADAFITARIPFTWKGTARADELCRLPEPFFEKLRSARCLRINVGAESGSQHVLDKIKKEYRVDEILTAADRASKAGISISYSFITGFPGETRRDFRATLDVIKAIRRKGSLLQTSIYLYSPYPGTELVRELHDNGMRLPQKLEDWENFDIEGAFLPRREPGFVRRVRNLNFYLRHGYAESARSSARKALQALSRFRCERDWYDFPVERYLADAWHGWAR